MDILPLIAGYAPFALVIGAAGAEHGDPVAAWAGSWLIYGGSAQLATIRTLASGGLLIAILTGLLVNARLLVYSASLSQRWHDQPRWFRIAAAPMIIDPTWAAAERHAVMEPSPGEQRSYFIAAGLTLGVCWSALIAAGAVLGMRIGWLDVDVVVPLCLLVLVGPSLRQRSSVAAIATAATVALVTADWPGGTGLCAAMGAGAAAGVLSDRRRA